MDFNDVYFELCEKCSTSLWENKDMGRYVMKRW